MNDTTLTEARAIIAALLQLAERGLTKRGHRKQLWETESRGVCNTRLDDTCAPSCVQHRAAIERARAWLERTETRQGRLIA